MNVLHITLANDEDLENPAELGDGQWSFYSFHRDSPVDPDRFVKYMNRRTGEIAPANIGLASKLKAGTAFWLSCFQHGNVVWHLKGIPMNTGEAICAGDQWDNAPLAGILVWEHKIADMGAKTYADRAADAHSFLEEYNAYVNGEGKGYAIEDGDGVELYSCWGFYESDYMIRDNVIPAVTDYMKAHGLTEARQVTDEEWDDESEAEAAENTLVIVVHGDASWLADHHKLYESVTAVTA